MMRDEVSRVCTRSQRLKGRVWLLSLVPYEDHCLTEQQEGHCLSPEASLGSDLVGTQPPTCPLHPWW